MKKYIIVFGVLIALVLGTWIICEIANSDNYDYQGYVVDVRQDDRNNTILSTIAGETQKSFVLRWYSREKYDNKAVKEIQIGDRILLTTTRNSDTDIKQMSVSEGYSTVGKLVYMEGLDSPFLLAVAPDTGVRYLVCLIFGNQSILANTYEVFADMNTGDTVRVFHKSPVYTSSISVVIEAVNMNEDDSIDSLTNDDISFIESNGYKVRVK